MERSSSSSLSSNPSQTYLSSPSRLNGSLDSRRLHSKSLGFIDLSSTRPPRALRPKDSIRENQDLTELFSPVKNSRTLDEDPPKIEVERRALPHRRKREREEVEFPDGLDVAPPSRSLFSHMDNNAIQRLHAMIMNFCRLEDGTLSTDIDLKQYAIDSGQTITNAVVQELCAIQPHLTRLNLSGCSEVTDAGLWAIAKHCEDIRDLNLSGCDSITHIGLRSISLRCFNITSLDFSGCHKLDDMGLTVLAGGGWHLEHVKLTGCDGVSDTGVGKLAKNSEKLTTLDLNGCVNLGEFGNSALKELGTNCLGLRELDLSGCRRIEDQGLRALAVGCTSLEKLCLSNCQSLTGATLKELCKNSRKLSILAVPGCIQLHDRDFETFHQAAFQNSLVTLDISGCVKISDRAIGAICQSVGGRLKKFLVAQCPGLTDFSSQIIGASCPHLRELDLSRCSQISDATIATLSRHITSLTSLNLTENRRVSTRALIQYQPSFEFVNMATAWLGYQPKPFAEKLIQDREHLRFITAMALRIQCFLRCSFARKKFREKKRWWLIHTMIPRFQAIVRGMLQRKRYFEIQRKINYVKNIIRVQSWYRKYIQIQKRLKQMKFLAFQSYKTLLAERIQRVFRGMKGRRIVRQLRLDAMNLRLLETKRRMRNELSALCIQRYVRGYWGRLEGSRRLLAYQLYCEEQHRRERLARLTQRLWRGLLGRRRAENRRQEILYQIKCWYASRNIQRIFRGHRGRIYAEEVRYLRFMQKSKEAATQIQRIFRGYRGRLLAAVARSLQQLRFREQMAAVEVQRVVRGHFGRVNARHYRLWKRKREIETKACIQIQRLFRGHKGREAYEVEKGLQKLEALARPLLSLLRQLEEKSNELSKIINKMEFFENRAHEDIIEMEKELAHVEKTTSKYTDSSRINGIPQRFLTKYLKVRLKDHYEHEKVSIVYECLPSYL